MSDRQTRHLPAFTFLETLFMVVTLGVFVMLLGAVTRPMWWDHAKKLLGKDSPPVEAAAKK
jgi:hypothetical protein